MTDHDTTLQILAADLAARLSPDQWDLTLDTVVESVATIAGDATLADALRPIVPLLECASSGTALDLAYDSPDAPADLRTLCRRLAREIDAECAWFEENPEIWAADEHELRTMIGEFRAVLDALDRVGRAARPATN